MKKLTDLLKDTDLKNVNYNDLISLDTDKLDQYIKKVSLPKDIKTLLRVCLSCDITDPATIIKIKTLPLTQLYSSYAKYGEGNIKTIRSILNNKKYFDLDFDLKILPFFQTEEEFNDVVSGNINTDELALDFNSAKGRENIVRKYTPLVNKLVSKYINKSNLSREELLSAALYGLSDAISSFNKDYTNKIDTSGISADLLKEIDEPDSGKKVSFLGYAYRKIQIQILRDIQQYNAVVDQRSNPSAKQYSVRVNAGGEYEEDDRAWAQVIGDNSDKLIDRNIAGIQNIQNAEAKIWTILIKSLEKVFSKKDVDIFLSSYGLMADKQKGADLAKKYGVSAAAIAQAKMKIIKYVQNTPKLRYMLQELYDTYTESVSVYSIGLGKDEILNKILEDESYVILAEALNKIDPQVVYRQYKSWLTSSYNKDSQVIKDFLANFDFNYVDSHYKKNKEVIISFLSYIYPTEDIRRLADITIINRFMEVMNIILGKQ